MEIQIFITILSFEMVEIYLSKQKRNPLFTAGKMESR